jgi:hypothetical protein
MSDVDRGTSGIKDMGNLGLMAPLALMILCHGTFELL